MKVKEILENCPIWMPNKNYEKNSPIISVLLPTFRRAESGLFEKAVKSVLNQEFYNLELIIIDDCSTDGTFEIINHYMEIDSRVNCIRHSFNVGLPAISEYEGYMKARGEYIAFIFDDNEWEKNAMSSMYEYMRKNKLKAAYGVYKAKYGEKEHEYIEFGTKDQPIENIRSTNFIANGSMVLHREVIENVGLYDPHLSLTRLCDWDLIQRICRKFRFEATGIFMGTENGAILNDSLGNTVQLNSWIANERMVLFRNEKLLPTNYEECDIFYLHDNCTQLYQDMIIKFINQYKQKVWLKNIEEETDYLKRINFKRRKKNIVFITFFIDASSILSIDRLNKNNENFNIRFLTPQWDFKREILNADMIIFGRNIDAYNEYINFAKCLNIPCYYYIDDNYLEIVKEDDDTYVENLAKQTTKENLKKFDGIFCSSKVLLEYFEENTLHDKLFLFEPIIDADNIHIHNSMNKNEEINISFFGGDFKNKIFNEIIVPVLNKLSNEIKINLILPETITISNIDRKNINIIKIEKTLDLDLAIKRFSEKEVDIQIHIMPNIKNNKYKTMNSLINATQMGAVLIASNYEPFNKINNIENMMMLCENNIEDWYKNLLYLAKNKELRIDMVNNSKKFCVESFSDTNILNTLDMILADQLEVDISYVFNKLEGLYTLFDANNIIDDEKSKPVNSNQQKESRIIESDILCFSKAISKEKKYSIKSTKDILSEIGILFTGENGQAKGKVSIEIYNKNKLIRMSEIELEKVVFNQWSYFNFDKIEKCMNKDLLLKLIFKYEVQSPHLGVYEDVRKRTVLYKLLNKFNISSSTLDVLYVDCK